jgi:regulator of extracellular matrix RemA (YlzA/DUF370 family)
MATYTKQLLSASTNGRPIKVTPTSSAGETIHTAHASDMDEIWLYAVNTDTVARKLTIEFGGTTAPDDLIEITVQPESGPVLVIPGLILTGGVIVKAFCATADVVLIVGWVNRITN